MGEEALLRASAPGTGFQDWEKSGFEECQKIAGYFLDGALVAAAGYKVWGATLAHICVATHAELRNRGFGRACVRKISKEAIRSGLVAQYQALFENNPSIAVARALEFVEFSRRIYVRCKRA